MQINSSSNISIKMMVLIPTEHQYQNMYQRSFSLGLNNGQAERLHGFFMNEGVNNNSPVSVVGAANTIGSSISLSATPTGMAAIPNGWGTQRLMFVLAADEWINDSTTITHYIQGYSEYHDPSYSGRVDPNAIFYINSITTVTRTKNMMTNSIDSRVSATYNVVYDPTGNSSYQQVGEPSAGLELVRPYDVITNLHSSAMYSSTPDVKLSVKTSSASNGANVSNRANNDPLKYFTNTVNAVVNGKSVYTGFNTPESVLANANGLVAEQAITTNSFIYSLARASGNMEPSYFTLSLLDRLYPGVSNIITLVESGGIISDPVQVATGLDTENTESMLNFTEETQVAQTFINALTANMSENLVSVIGGTITNAGGAPFTTISNISSFLEGVDITPYGNRIINYLNSVIMPQISLSNLRLVDLVFNCDLLGDTVVSVSVENSQPIIYRVPTFADSLYTPVLTNSMTKEALIGDFESVVDTVMSMSPCGDTGNYSGY